jgi:hypothetical protein
MVSEGTKDYRYILDNFGKDVIEGRTNWLKELMDAYIKQEGIGEFVYISETIFFHVILDYFADIDRLKEFHNIDRTNVIKIYSYLVYWILRRKPIQIIQNASEEYAFVNEQFCTELLRGFLFDNPANIPIRQESQESINDFINTMSYFFKYRDYSAKSIELTLIAFNAGRGYQFSVDYQR